jgi:hypothetical protein
MKKKVIIACASLVAIIAIALPSFSINPIENSLIQQNFSVIKIGEEPGNTRALWSNIAGTYFCCGPGNVRPDCGSTPDCPNQ